MLISELRRQLQREASETEQDDGYNLLVLSWIQDALYDFGNETDFRYFNSETPITTVIGDSTYSLPATHQDIRAIQGVSPGQRKLEYLPQEKILQRQLDLTQTGIPTYYYYKRGLYDSMAPVDMLTFEIGLWPVPVAIESLVVYTMVSPPTLVDDSIVPVVDSHIPCLKHRVRYYIALDDKDTEIAMVHDAAFRQELNRLGRKERAKRDNHRRLGVTDIPERTKRYAQLDPSHFHN